MWRGRARYGGYFGESLTRNINQLEEELEAGLRQRVFNGYQQLVRARKNCEAFHPNGEQTIHDLHPAVVVIERQHAGVFAFCIHNVSDSAIDAPMPMTGLCRDLISGRPMKDVVLKPYKYLWLKYLK